MEGTGQRHESVLFWLEPMNKPAMDVVVQQPPGRYIKLQANGVWSHCIEVKLEEPRQPKGHIMFGRNSICTVRFPKAQKSVSSMHCYIDINRTSGELLLCTLASQPTTWLDGEQVGIPRFRSDPPQTRAMVYQKSKRFQIAEAVFNIMWPQIGKQRMDTYHQAKIERVGKRDHQDQDDELTDFEFAMKLDSACSTRAPTRAGTRQSTPFGVEPLDRCPIRVKELGSGAYGTVHLAVDRMSADFVAVKSFNSKQGKERTAKEAEARHEFISELMAMRQLNHANIVQIRGWRELDYGRIEIDLQYCSKGNLRNVWEEVRQNLHVLWWDVANGLAYLHAKNMVHRDVKPENILVDRPVGGVDSFKLADFGKSKDIEQAQTLCGTPYYMAPEIFQDGEKFQSPKMDIYALGVVFFEFAGCLDGLSSQIQHWRRMSKIPGFIRQKSTSVSIQDNDVARFLRSMIHPSRFERPTAKNCIEFVLEKWTDFSLRIAVAPKKIDVPPYFHNAQRDNPCPSSSQSPVTWKASFKVQQPEQEAVPDGKRQEPAGRPAPPPIRRTRRQEESQRQGPRGMRSLERRNEVLACLRPRKTEDRVRKVKQPIATKHKYRMPGAWNDSD